MEWSNLMGAEKNKKYIKKQDKNDKIYKNMSSMGWRNKMGEKRKKIYQEIG